MFKYFALFFVFIFTLISHASFAESFKIQVSSVFAAATKDKVNATQVVGKILNGVNIGKTAFIYITADHRCLDLANNLITIGHINGKNVPLNLYTNVMPNSYGSTTSLYYDLVTSTQELNCSVYR